MPSSFRLLLVCSLVLMPPISAMMQTASLVTPPKPGADGVYEVPSSDLKRLDSSGGVEFPAGFSAYEINDTVIVEVTISPEGKVKKAKAVSGKSDALKEAAEDKVKKRMFEPYVVNGTAVPVRTQIIFAFKNTLDDYRDPNGDPAVHLEMKTAHALLEKDVPPLYPPDARIAGITGRVRLRVIIGEDGRVHALHIITGHPILAVAAYNAVLQWKYKPYVENGKALPVDTEVMVEFSIR